MRAFLIKCILLTFMNDFMIIDNKNINDTNINEENIIDDNLQ